jgi:hypothetical protein
LSIDALEYRIAGQEPAMTALLFEAHRATPQLTVATRLDRVDQYRSAPAIDHRRPGILDRRSRAGDDGFAL